MNDLNKITNTRIGDNIHYYVNGSEGRGIVVKMSNAYVSVLKGDGNIDEIHINDTFFIKDILTNKTWNDMTMEERTIELQKAHAFSPRFLTKTWEDLPRELKDVLSKSNIEESTHGQIGGNRAGVSTKTPFDAEEDYEGESDDKKTEEFKHEKEKPSVDKNNGMEEDHKKKEEFDGMKEDWRPTGGESDKQKIKSTWESWLEKDALDPKANPQSDLLGDPNTATVRNTRIGQKPPEVREAGGLNFDLGSPDKMIDGKPTIRHTPSGAAAAARDTARNLKRQRAEGGHNIGQKPKDRDVRKLWEVWLSKTDWKKYNEAPDPENRTRKRFKDPNFVTNLSDTNRKELEGAGATHAGGKATRMTARQLGMGISAVNDNKQRSRKLKKQYGKPLYGVTSLEKEGDGAGNSGVSSLETAGVYNTRYSDNSGRYRDQQKDKE